jgi:hypothetical protein
MFCPSGDDPVMKEETSMFDIAVAEKVGPGLIERMGLPRPLSGISSA